MLFKRREKPLVGERVRAWFWPRRGWWRAWYYVWHRVTRLAGSPHAIALGFAAGVLASFTPFMGFHFMIGALLALVAGGNVIASALGTFVGNPLTFPFIWLLTYKFGNFLLGAERTERVEINLPTVDLLAVLGEPSLVWTEIWAGFWPLIKPMTVGGIPIGIVAAAVCYFPIRAAVGAYQHKRRRRLSRRERLRKDAARDVVV